MAGKAAARSRPRLSARFRRERPWRRRLCANCSAGMPALAYAAGLAADGDCAAPGLAPRARCRPARDRAVIVLEHARAASGHRGSPRRPCSGISMSDRSTQSRWQRPPEVRYSRGPDTGISLLRHAEVADGEAVGAVAAALRRARSGAVAPMNRLPDFVRLIAREAGARARQDGGAIRAATVSPCWTPHSAVRVGCNVSGKGAICGSAQFCLPPPSASRVNPAFAQAGAPAAAVRKAGANAAPAAKPAASAGGRELLDLVRADLRRRHLRPHQRRDALLLGDRGARRLAELAKVTARARRERAGCRGKLRARLADHRGPAGRGRRRRRLRHDADRGGEALPDPPRPARDRHGRSADHRGAQRAGRQARIRQLAASLDRLNGMGFTFGQRYVVVNIPAAVAEAVEDGKVARRYVTVVGKVDRPSPTLTTSITAVNLNPTWTVPLSILKKDIVTKMRKDPGYVGRMRMRVLDSSGNEVDARAVDWHSDRTPNFTVRQDSGNGNALGNLRIDMPNPHSVYMHDTNHKEFFSADYRFQSSGCTRVQGVRDLRGLDPEGQSGLGPQGDRRRDRDRQAHHGAARAADSGGMDLSHRLGEPGRHDPFPQRCLQSRSGAGEADHGRCRPAAEVSCGARLRLRAAIGRSPAFRPVSYLDSR